MSERIYRSKPDGGGTVPRKRFPTGFFFAFGGQLPLRRERRTIVRDTTKKFNEIYEKFS